MYFLHFYTQNTRLATAMSRDGSSLVLDVSRNPLLAKADTVCATERPAIICSQILITPQTVRYHLVIFSL